MQSDLGSYPDLYDVLTSETLSQVQASHIGEILGKFLSDLRVCMPADCSSFREAFRNSYQDEVMQATIRQVEGFMKEAGVPDYQELASRASNHWRRRMELRETWAQTRASSGCPFAFGQGDIWFSGLLVAMSPLPNGNPPKIGVVDWEFAGPNHPAADLAQLGMLLPLHLFAWDSGY
jgi:hypothetical protein